MSFLQNCKQTEMEILVLCVITFESIKIQTRSAPQNDLLNLSFVKDKHVVGKKMARYGLKMTIYQLLFFGSSPNLHTHLSTAVAWSVKKGENTVGKKNAQKWS